MTDPVIPAKTRVPTARALARPRVEGLLDGAWNAPCTLVVAPAGSGKTTQLAQFAAACDPVRGRVAWYQAGSSEAETTDLLRHLEASLRAVLPEIPTGWRSVGAAATALDAWPGAPTALVIDDLHALEGTPGEAAIEELIAYLPAWLHIVVGARRPPRFNLSRLRVSGRVVEIGPDDLRFRSWEVEELFRKHYGAPLPPEELAELARRTGGWAAGLQLFHLATRGKPPSERRRVLASLSSRLRHVREYLARNVLEDLDDELRHFLVHTSVLGRLSGPWCDELLERTGSDHLLTEIEQRHLFLTTPDDGTTYLEHEVLRTHLEELLIEEIGEQAAIERFRRAGQILERAGNLTESLRAYCRAQDWTAADRLLGGSGDRLFTGPGSWIDPLPAALADHDSWVLLATARQQLATGHWPAALHSYRRGEEAFGGSRAALACRKERFALAGWLDPAAAVSRDWTGALRRALDRNPRGVLDELHDDVERAGSRDTHLAAGLAALAAGDAEQALALCDRVARDGSSSPMVSALAHLASAGAAHLLRRPEADTIMTAAIEPLDTMVAPWLARLLAATASGDPEAVVAEAGAARVASADTANPWIDPVLDLAAGSALLAGDHPVAAADMLGSAKDGFVSVGAGVLGAWCAALDAVATLRSDRGDAGRRALEAAHLARATQCAGALALAGHVAAAAGLGAGPPASVDGAPIVDLRWMVVGPHGPLTAARPPAPVTPAAPGSRRLSLRCFGRFQLTADDVEVDLRQLKPRVRALLHLLAIHAGRTVHRDEMLGALWPEDSTRAGIRSLQVAVSSLRQVLDGLPGATVVRDGEGYCLDLAGGQADVIEFARLVGESRTARAEGRPPPAAEADDIALALYRGDLLPEDGAADWAAEARDRHRSLAAELAEHLALHHLDNGRFDPAVTTAERGLQIDRYRDGLWKVIITAHEQSGNRAAAARTTRSYHRMLAELGIEL